MFETSVVQARALAAGGRSSLLTVSLAAHTAVIAGAIAMSVATVDFPSRAPDEYALAPVMVPVRVPPPLGTPDGGRTQQPAATPQPRVTPAEITAPAAIPAEVNPIESVLPGDGSESDGPATGTGPLGVPWGVDGGAGDLDAPPSTTIGVPVEAPIYQVGGEVNAPVLLHRVEPAYPPAMARYGVPATVVIRCVIDTSGRVRDPEVIVPALPPFNKSVIEAVKQWRYKPGSLRGSAVEVWLDLTVTFRTK